MSIGENEKLLRQFEKLLDEHHKTLNLWRRDAGISLYAVLAYFDMASLFLPPKGHGIGATQQSQNLEDGLSQAVRWIATKESELHPNPTNDSRIFAEARNFLCFAGDYSHLADFHIMYGRGQVGLQVNEEERTVQFVTPVDAPLPGSLLGMAEDSYRLGKLPIISNASAMGGLRDSMLEFLTRIEFSYDSGQISIPDLSVVNDYRIRAFLSHVQPKEPLSLQRDDDLVGFTVGDFETFIGALIRWSYCCNLGSIHSVKYRGKELLECAPTQCINRQTFVNSMRELTGLSEGTVETICKRLTYDWRTKRPDLHQQPLFFSENTVTWSVLAIINSRHIRNMLKLMSRTPGLQDHTATLIGTRERRMLGELDRLLRRGKTVSRLNTAIVSEGDAGEVDLLGYNQRFPDELLIVEGKAVLGVDEINEVETVTSEMKDGQEQLAEIKNILARMSDEQKKAKFKFVKWHLVKTIFGIVVAADAEPNEKYDHSEYPGISLQTIIARLRDNHFASPKKFWQRCKERPWLENLRAYTESYASIKVGDVTYKLPVVVQPADQANEIDRMDVERVVGQVVDSKEQQRPWKKTRKRRRR